MTNHPPPALRWRKSSYSGSANNCVEVASLAGHVAVRDSKSLQGPHLAFTSGQWRAFVATVKADGLSQG